MHVLVWWPSALLMMPPLWHTSALVVRRGEAGSRAVEGDGKEKIDEQRKSWKSCLKLHFFLQPLHVSFIPPPTTAPPVLHQLGVSAGSPPPIYHHTPLLQLRELPNVTQLERQAFKKDPATFRS